MLALIPISTVSGTAFDRGYESVAATIPSASSPWRRFMDALMRALSAWSV
jgi:hypothetical protein